MYRVGYIDDEPIQFKNYAKKIHRRYSDMELVLIDGCRTKIEFLEKIYEEHVDVLLIDYKMAASYGFNGSTLISFINDHIRDLECFILTAVEQDRIEDGLVAKRNRFSKTIFDTEGDNPEKIEELNMFIMILKESSDVFRVRRKDKVERYQELFSKRKNGGLSELEEDEFQDLYKVLSSYGMIEKLPQYMVSSRFEEKLDEILKVGNRILEKHKEN